MSALTHAEERAQKALSRLEQVLRAAAAGERTADPRAALERAAIERDCELLREECDTLRRELAGAREQQTRLANVVDAVEGRLDGAITQLDELAGE